MLTYRGREWNLRKNSAQYNNAFSYCPVRFFCPGNLSRAMNFACKLYTYIRYCRINYLLPRFVFRLQYCFL